MSLDFLDDPPVDEITGSLPVADEAGATLPPHSCPECAAEGITNSFKAAGGLGSHRKSAHGIAGKAEHKPKGRSGDAPRVAINVGGGKAPKGANAKDAAKLARTAKGATSFANLAATGLVLLGQGEDAGDIASNAEAFGNAIGGLAQYQPWLCTVFAPEGDMTGEVAAWFGLSAVTAAMVIPIGARHGWVPRSWAAAFGVAAGAASGKIPAEGPISPTPADDAHVAV